MRFVSNVNTTKAMQKIICLGFLLASVSAAAKSSTLGMLKQVDHISFGDFLTKHVDASAFKKDVDLDAEKEKQKETIKAAVKTASLKELRSQEAQSFGDFVQGKALPKIEAKKLQPPTETKPVVQEHIATVKTVPAPAVKTQTAPVVATRPVSEPAAIQIAVQRHDGQIKKTTKPIQTPASIELDDAVTLSKKHLRIDVSPGAVAFSLKELRFFSKDDVYSVSLVNTKTGEAVKKSSLASLFVRDTAVVHLDPTSFELRPRKEGVTELYVVAGGKAFFLPVVVEKEFNAPKLAMVDEFFALEKPAAVQGEQARISRKSDQPVYSESVGTDSVGSEVVNGQDLNSDFTVSSAPFAYAPIKLRVISDNMIAPRSIAVPRVVVSVVGTKFRSMTDGLGYVDLDIPQDAHILLKLEHPDGEFRKSIVEIDASQPNPTVTLMRDRPLQVYETAIKRPAVDSLGTLCGVVRDARSELAPRSNITIGTDSRAVGPFFFKPNGILDHSGLQRATGSDGRFCFFNVEPGPIALDFFEDDVHIATKLDAMFEGAHIWQTFDLYGEKPVSTKLAMVPTAEEQNASSSALADSLKLVDMVDMNILGSRQGMTYADPGKVEATDGADVHHGRAFAVSQSSDFEPTMYALNADYAEDNVSLLYPSGFVEAMSVKAMESYKFTGEKSLLDFDRILGTVVVEHNAFEGQKDGVTFKLVNEDGAAVGDGWYYSEDNTARTKAIFFNLPLGVYQLIVETESGDWIAADTVYAFNETLYSVRTGSPVILK